MTNKLCADFITLGTTYSLGNYGLCEGKCCLKLAQNKDKIESKIWLKMDRTHTVSKFIIQMNTFSVMVVVISEHCIMTYRLHYKVEKMACLALWLLYQIFFYTLWRSGIVCAQCLDLSQVRLQQYNPRLQDSQSSEHNQWKTFL